MLSHAGGVRSKNEDAVAYVLPRDGDPALRRGALLLVADGMGGHAAGEVASRIATDIMCHSFYAAKGTVPAALAASFVAANDAIFTRGQNDPSCAGMGTTCTVIAVQADHAYLAHVGDSRAYLQRDGELHQLSPDHTLVAELVRQGALAEHEAEQRPDRNVIIKALGTRPQVDPLIWTEGMPLLHRDRLVLCSDGLSDLVDTAKINRIISEAPPFDACERLIEAALQAGGYDNISVGVFLIEPSGATSRHPERPTRKVGGCLPTLGTK